MNSLKYERLIINIYKNYNSFVFIDFIFKNSQSLLLQLLQMQIFTHNIQQHNKNVFITFFTISSLKVTLWCLDWPINIESLPVLLHTIKSLLWFTKRSVESQRLVKSRRWILWRSWSTSEFSGLDAWFTFRSTAATATKRPTAQAKTERYRSYDSQLRWVL